MCIFSRFSAIIILLLASLGCFAQTTYYGTIFHHDGTQQQAYLVPQSPYESSLTCTYFESLDSDSLRYFGPDEITGYKYKGGKYFVSKEILSDGVIKPTFLEFIVNGNANLYLYGGPDQTDYYYIETPEGELVLLENNEKEYFINNKAYKKYSNQYIGVLTYTFRDAPELVDKISKADFVVRDLANLTVEYHQLTCAPGDTCIVYEKYSPQPVKKELHFKPNPQKKPTFNGGLYAGYSYHVAKGNTYFPNFGIGGFNIGTFVNMKLQKDGKKAWPMSLQLGIDYERYERLVIDGSGIKINVYKPSIMMHHRIFNIQESTVYFMWGAALAFQNSHESVIYPTSRIDFTGSPMPQLETLGRLGLGYYWKIGSHGILFEIRREPGSGTLIIDDSRMIQETIFHTRTQFLVGFEF